MHRTDDRLSDLMKTPRPMHPAVCLREQRGVALVMSVLMLVLLTLLVLAVINMSTVNLRVAHNEQTKTESIAAAQRAIEQVASANFPADPQPVTVAVDINNDGRSDYSVAVAKPECKNAVPIKVVELDIAQPSDVACFTSSAVGSAGSTGNSVCANTQWDIAAKTTDAANSGATVTVHQGIGQRVPIDTTC